MNIGKKSDMGAALEHPASAMDRTRPKSRAKQVKRAIALMLVAIALVSGGIAIANIDFTSRRVERDSLLIETVQRGQMEIKVSANGQLLPKNIELIASQVTGRVAKLHVKPGDTVSRGEVLADLTNPELNAAAEEAYSAWEGAVAEQAAFEVDLETHLLNQESLVLQAKFNFDKAQLQLEAESKLVGENIIPQIDYKRTQLNVAQLNELHRIEQKRLEKLRDNVKSQMTVKRARVNQLARGLERVRSQAAQLQVVAGIDGIVQEMAIEVGQQLQPGSPISRIAQQNQLYAELKVPARQAGEVAVGQAVVVDTRNGLVDGEVSRIDPGVTEGTVIVDVDLNSKLPRGARPQLQVEGTIYIAQLEDTLFVGKPTYVKAEDKVAIYKLDADGHYARRVVVEAGKVSVNHVEVREGLQAGDRIVTSDSSAWQDHETILLN